MSRRINALLTLIVLLSAQRSIAQPNIEWARIYRDSDSDQRGGVGFLDLYPMSDGSYASCGAKALEHSYEKWILITDAQSGDVTAQATHHQTDSDQKLLSLVQADDGDLVAVGHEQGVNGGDVFAMRINTNGEEIWRRYYGDNGTQRSNAIIELKEGNFLIAGDNGHNAYLIKISPEGDVIWERNYGNQNRVDANCFWAMKETEDGVILAGRSVSHAWLLKIDRNGDEVWSRTYGNQDDQRRSEYFFALISVPEGGFLAAGQTRVLGSDQSPFLVVRVTDVGDVIWQREYDPFNDGGEDVVRSAAYMPDGGFILVGQDTEIAGLALRINGDGEPLWSIRIGIDDRPIDSYGFKAVVTDFDGGILIAGQGSNNRNVSGGLLLKLAPERFAPVIIEYSPELLEYPVLRGDSIEFHILAMDQQNDSISYFYRLGNDTISTDTNVVVVFPDLGDFTVTGIASDGQFADSVVWNVNVTDLFIGSHSPDTLSLSIRRGTSRTFSLDSVAAVEGDPVTYQWTLTDLNSFEAEDAGMENGATVDFLRSGNFQLEGLAYRGESSDNVIWTISVRSAILDFTPRNLSLSAFRDSTLQFSLLPFNPESDSLKYNWLLDGTVSETDTLDNFAFTFSQSGEHQISGILLDGAEGDTINWTVTVEEPGEVDKWSSGQVDKYVLLSTYPNPFNCTTTIRFSVPSSSSSSSSLTLHDLSGRQVRECVSAEVQAGEHTYILNGEDLPAGIYLIRLKTGSFTKVNKVVLVR